MSADFRAVLDACVLIPMPLADTLLRMAEHPRLYRPFWSERIMGEVTSNLVGKWKHSPEKASRRASKIGEAFPEASVEGYEPLIQAVNNHPKDRHVLAAAICSKANLIVTYNKKDFPKAALTPGISSAGARQVFCSLCMILTPPLQPTNCTNRRRPSAFHTRNCWSASRKQLPASSNTFVRSKI
jgi:predicted nucleic acid-binding protein